MLAGQHGCVRYQTLDGVSIIAFHSKRWGGGVWAFSGLLMGYINQTELPLRLHMSDAQLSNSG
ncbi:MAG: hypothetical protein J07HX5_00689 [halophilic archaeon J07HX5]|nr:MAG: hypothetical protein J07HX5_00689 [halophilic archaeon J07HX5]